MTTQLNKVHRVTTINRVAEQLGEDPDWLSDVADGVMAFTDVGIENLIELIEVYREDPDLLKPLRDLRRSE